LSPGVSAKRRGTRSEYAVRDIFRAAGWAVVRSGGSLGPVDLVCVKHGQAMLVQVKRSTAAYLYLGRDIRKQVRGFAVVFVADFGRGNIRVVPKKTSVTPKDGVPLRKFLEDQTKHQNDL
jgi:Holliday junction resolvase